MGQRPQIKILGVVDTLGRLGGALSEFSYPITPLTAVHIPRFLLPFCGPSFMIS